MPVLTMEQFDSLIDKIAGGRSYTDSDAVQRLKDVGPENTQRIRLECDYSSQRNVYDGEGVLLGQEVHHYDGPTTYGYKLWKLDNSRFQLHLFAVTGCRREGRRTGFYRTICRDNIELNESEGVLRLKPVE